MGIYDRKSQTSDKIEMFPEVFPPLSGIGRTDIFPQTETSSIIFFYQPATIMWVREEAISNGAIHISGWNITLNI